MKKSLELLEEINMARGILPLEDIVEVGRNHETGFVWLKQEKENGYLPQHVNDFTNYVIVVISTQVYKCFAI